MKIIERTISIEELNEMSEKLFGDFVKAVVDIEKGIIIVNAELHTQLEAYLLQNGSKQEDLWGIRIYPALEANQMIQYISQINIRASQGNNSMKIENVQIQEKIKTLLISKISN